MEFSHWITHLQPPRVERLLKKAAVEDMISFAGGLPAAELFPANEIQRAFERVTKEHASEALQYNWREGYEPLRQQISELMKLRGVAAKPNEILITHGAQQALDLLAKLLINPGERIAVESPTYVPAIQAFETRGPRLVPLARNSGSFEEGAFDNIGGDLKFIYSIANGHNPTGGVLDRSSREQLVAESSRIRTVIIEDDAYGLVQYGARANALKALEDPASPVIYVGSFSKVLSPGLRVGWILAPQEITKQLALLKQAADLQTATLNQIVLSEYLKENSLEEHLARSLAFYRERRDCMTDALQQHLGEAAEWEVPAAGFSFWLKLPPGATAEPLLQEAVKRGVAFEPGRPFFVSVPRAEFVRLSFSNENPERIGRGVEALSELITAYSHAPVPPRA